MNLALFFTYPVSAMVWKESGLLDREKLIYEVLLENKAVDKIYWFTYGPEDKAIETKLRNGIEIVPIPRGLDSKIGNFLYSILLPVIHHKILATVDVFKTNQMKGAWSAVIAKIIFRKKLVVRTGYSWSLFSCRENGAGLKCYFIRMIEHVTGLFADKLVVSSKADFEYLQEKAGLKGKITVIPNFIDTEAFRPLNIQKAPRSICFVGRLNRQKNLISLLDALAGLPYILSIIGSGDQKERLQKHADAKGVKVNFHDNVPNDELPNILNQSEAFILPSLYEGLPKSLLEAMACGLPCIGTDVEGIREIIIDNENGILCGTDGDSIRNAVEKVMNDSGLREKLGKEARKSIVNKFSLEIITALESGIYKEICVR